jgi:hypothetical protein
MTAINNFSPNIAASGPLVVALVYDGLCTFEFSIVAEIFGLDRPEMGAGWYRFASAALEPGPLRAHGGLVFRVDDGLELLDQADLIVIPGWKGVDVDVPDALLASLRCAWQRGARLASAHTLELAALRGRLPGHALPFFVRETPMGGGKKPVSLNFTPKPQSPPALRPIPAANRAAPAQCSPQSG